MSHEPTFGPRESAVEHPMPDMTENYIAEEARLKHELSVVRKHLADIRARCCHHFVPTGSPEEMGFKETLVPGVWNLVEKSAALFTCTECGKNEQISAGEGGWQCPCCGTKTNYKWISDADRNKYFGDQEFDWYDSPALISCSNCDFKGAQMLFDR